MRKKKEPSLAFIKGRVTPEQWPILTALLSQRPNPLEPSVSSDVDLDADADIVHLFASADISALEKARMLSKSVYEFHR